MLEAFKTLISGILEVAKSYKGDWNENDSSSPNYIKNRTHYATEGEIILLDEKKAYSDYWFDIGESIEVGNEYKVIVDNVEYNCTVFEFDGFLAAGAKYDYEIGDVDYSEYPFYFFSEGDNWICLYFNDVATFDTESSGTPHSVRISRIDEIVKTLDVKYLPEDLDEIVKEKFPGGLGYYIPEGTVLVDRDIVGNYDEFSDCQFITPGYSYHVIFGNFNDWIQAYKHEDGFNALGDMEEYGFMLGSSNGHIWGAFKNPGYLFVEAGDDIPVMIDSNFIPDASDKSEKLIIQFTGGTSSLTTNGASFYFKEFKSYDEVKTAAEKGNIVLVFSDGDVITPTSVSIESAGLFIELITYINGALYCSILYYGEDSSYMHVNNIFRFVKTS